MKRFICLVCMLMIVSVVNVKADATPYYTNSNGVNFTEEEYNFLSDFYFEGYQDYMTLSDYNDFISSDIMNGQISVQTYDDDQLLPSSGGLARDSQYFETSYKKLKLSTSCTTNCTVATTLTWKQVPATKSYDHIGAYFYETSLIGAVTSRLFYNTSSVLPSYTTNNSSGVDATFKYPNTTYEVQVVQNFTVKNQGRVYVSYQHAKNSISAANSQLFSLSTSGYGHVFLFDSSIRSKYDAMAGLQKTF